MIQKSENIKCQYQVLVLDCRIKEQVLLSKTALVLAKESNGAHTVNQFLHTQRTILRAND